jgi:hypothetical protein
MWCREQKKWSTKIIVRKKNNGCQEQKKVRRKMARKIEQ